MTEAVFIALRLDRRASQPEPIRPRGPVPAVRTGYSAGRTSRKPMLAFTLNGLIEFLYVVVQADSLLP